MPLGSQPKKELTSHVFFYSHFKMTQVSTLKATVTFDVSEEEVELFKGNLNFFTGEVDLNGNSCAEERAINHLLSCIRNENIRNIDYLNKPIRQVNISFNRVDEEVTV